jgi:hypothetical protein
MRRTPKREPPIKGGYEAIFLISHNSHALYYIRQILTLSVTLNQSKSIMSSNIDISSTPLFTCTWLSYQSYSS